MSEESFTFPSTGFVFLACCLQDWYQGNSRTVIYQRWHCCSNAAGSATLDLPLICVVRLLLPYRHREEEILDIFEQGKVLGY